MYCNLNQYLLLFSDCIISEGYLNCIIYDLTRKNNSSYIPKSYVEFINKCKEYSLDEVFKYYHSNEDVLNEYIDFTLEREYGFLCDKALIKAFPKIENNKLSPEYIDNCILKLEKYNYQYLNKLNIIFDELLVNSLEIRISSICFEDLDQLIRIFNSSIIESISIYINQYDGVLKFDKLNDLFKSNLRIKKVVFCNQSKIDLNNESVIKITQENLDQLLKKHTPVTNIISLSFFLEAQKVNPYLFKKMYIDETGVIKNFEESNESFGNISDIENINDLLPIINSLSYKDIWDSPKEKINICSDCENKLVCFDTRIPKKVKKSDKIYFENECEYNPYIGKKQSENGFLSLKECGVISNERGFSIDHEKIAKINAVLWNEE
jgi:SPASM domain peptide maturase of grasp-with-spasm system